MALVLKSVRASVTSVSCSRGAATAVPEKDGGGPRTTSPSSELSTPGSWVRGAGIRNEKGRPEAPSFDKDRPIA